MIRPLRFAVAACCAEASGTKAPRIARQAKSGRIFLQIKIISPHMTSRVKAGILLFSERRTRCEVFETLISVKAVVAATGSRTYSFSRGEPSLGVKYAIKGPSVVQQVR